MNTTKLESHGAVPKLTDFEAPHEVSEVELAFPANVAHLMPAYADIPEEFMSMSNPWAAWQAEWFSVGLKQMPTAKPGIDVKAVMRHLGAIQGSYWPKHEHKAAAVAYLASRWLERSISTS